MSAIDSQRMVLRIAKGKGEKDRYSAPSGWIGRRVDVQWDDIHVRLLDPGTGHLLREHLRTRRGWHRIPDDDRPTRTPPKTLALLAAAQCTRSRAGGARRRVRPVDDVDAVVLEVPHTATGVRASRSSGLACRRPLLCILAARTNRMPGRIGARRNKDGTATQAPNGQ